MFFPEKIFIFQETGLSYISGNLLYFKKQLFEPKDKTKPTLKMFLYFRKWNFLAPSLKNLLYFNKEFTKPENKKMTVDLVCMPNVSNNEFLGF